MKLITAAAMDTEKLLAELGTTVNGQSEVLAAVNRDKYGSNVMAKSKEKSLLKKLTSAFVNPFTAILFALAVISGITDIVIPLYKHNQADLNPATVIIILVMVTVSGTLRFFQENKSQNAAARLLAMITTTCTVVRPDEGSSEIPLSDVTVGDVVLLSAGDMIPADVRILQAADLFVSQSALTGESEPVEKTSALSHEDKNATECNCLAFLGTSVISGSARAVAVAVGSSTIFGSVAQAVTQERTETSFSKGINSVSYVLIRFMCIMVPIVFVLNGLTKSSWIDAFLFAISIAVGLTPEMLPMIVTTCLAKGAVSMSHQKTIVKDLNAIQNFGAMDILCTDKTGTLTQDKVALEYHLDVLGKENIRVLRHAYLNSYFQTGYKNLMDLAIIQKTELEEAHDSTLLDLSEYYRKVDEIPFDFSRRRLSVIVEDKRGKTQMITKGAVEEMLSVCTYAEYCGTVTPLTDEIRREVLKTSDRLNEDGMRVIAVAQKTRLPESEAFSTSWESEMVLIGYLAFLDPPKETTAYAIRALQDYGVQVKILTGDNEKVTQCICRQVGLSADFCLTGEQVELISDEALPEIAEKTVIFAKLSPTQKARIVTALRSRAHTVGYMGDGINDAAAMKASDIGISVDTAVDVAKESADIILLEKDLMVLEKGILEGRKTYANMIKYIKMTASSNFGNMFSVLAASALLPFLPMQSMHLILLNMIYDLSCTAIPWDHVDKDFLKVPRKWDASGISGFMIFMGPVSSIFDWMTYLFLYFILCPAISSGGLLYTQIPAGSVIEGGAFAGMDMKFIYMALFQAGWFIESMWSQSLIIHMIRTPKIPFLQSHAAAPVTLLSFTGIGVLTLIPFTGLGSYLGFAALPYWFFGYLAVCIFLYMALATGVKKLYIKKYGELL